MTSKLWKKLAPLFMAAATAFAVPSFAQSAAPIENNLLSDLMGTTSQKVAPAAVDAGPKPVYKMTYAELLKETRNNHDEAWKLYEFYQLRRVYLNTDVNENSIDKVIREMEILNNIDSEKPIELRVNSPGGSVYDGLRLYNKMKEISNPIRTVCDNMAASMGAVIFIAGDERILTPTGRVLVHEVAAGTRGKTSDMEIDVNHAKSLEDDLLQIISKHTGLSMEDLRRIAKEDVFYSAQESLALGFADKIQSGKPEKRYEPGSRPVAEELFPDNRVREYYKRRAAEKEAAPVKKTQAPAPTIQ